MNWHHHPFLHTSPSLASMVRYAERDDDANSSKPLALGVLIRSSRSSSSSSHMDEDGTCNVASHTSSSSSTSRLFLVMDMGFWSSNLMTKLPRGESMLIPSPVVMESSSVLIS